METRPIVAAGRDSAAAARPKPRLHAPRSATSAAASASPVASKPVEEVVTSQRSSLPPLSAFVAAVASNDTAPTAETHASSSGAVATAHAHARSHSSPNTGTPAPVAAPPQRLSTPPLTDQTAATTTRPGLRIHPAVPKTNVAHTAASATHTQPTGAAIDLQTSQSDPPAVDDAEADDAADASSNDSIDEEDEFEDDLSDYEDEDAYEDDEDGDESAESSVPNRRPVDVLEPLLEDWDLEPEESISEIDRQRRRRMARIEADLQQAQMQHAAAIDQTARANATKPPTRISLRPRLQATSKPNVEVSSTPTNDLLAASPPSAAGGASSTNTVNQLPPAVSPSPTRTADTPVRAVEATLTSATATSVPNVYVATPTTPNPATRIRLQPFTRTPAVSPTTVSPAPAVSSTPPVELLWSVPDPFDPTFFSSHYRADAHDLYFAYGSNLNLLRMRARRIEVVGGRALSARLADHRLVFDKMSESLGADAFKPGASGYANLVAATGASVYGALYIVRRSSSVAPLAGLEGLDVYEGVAQSMYARQRIAVVLQDGTSVVATTYFACPNACAPSTDLLAPTQSYLNHLLAGRAVLPAHYLAQLQQCVVSWMPDPVLTMQPERAMEISEPLSVPAVSLSSPSPPPTQSAPRTPLHTSSKSEGAEYLTPTSWLPPFSPTSPNRIPVGRSRLRVPRSAHSVSASPVLASPGDLTPSSSPAPINSSLPSYPIGIDAPSTPVSKLAFDEATPSPTSDATVRMLLPTTRIDAVTPLQPPPSSVTLSLGEAPTTHVFSGAAFANMPVDDDTLVWVSEEPDLDDRAWEERSVPVSTVAHTPPAPRLVCIETNPGPRFSVIKSKVV